MRIRRTEAVAAGPAPLLRATTAGASAAARSEPFSRASSPA